SRTCKCRLQKSKRNFAEKEARSPTQTADAEGVGEDAGADTEQLGPGDVVVPAGRGGQHRPARHVHPDDGRGHRPGPGPLGRGERVADSVQPAVRPSRQVSHRGTSRPGPARTARAAPGNNTTDRTRVSGATVVLF